MSSNSTTAKSREEMLFQCSGAIVAVIVIGIFIIFSIILVTLKAYNKKTRIIQELGPSTNKKMSTSTTKTSLAVRSLGQNSFALGTLGQNSQPISTISTTNVMPTSQNPRSSTEYSLSSRPTLITGLTPPGIPLENR
ncbi:noncompact myelin-associated protein [Polyodon spathula]|uniref:noncompact myelin-associated protein n=1 Tax=Polyodon spathula TaxID=7913 RepID=UPI001B7F77DB|nr:noncompact myelin-associated protein [Polyodon spathula]XP_041090039.1 noncompact myelin-associated protein [Polyodon spathula]